MTTTVIDRDAIEKLLNMIGGDMEDLQELVEEFADSTPGIVDTMRDAAKSGDLDTLRISSHGLKSNAADMGATVLSELCRDLEHACRNKDVPDPEETVRAIAEELTRAQAALSDFKLTDG